MEEKNKKYVLSYLTTENMTIDVEQYDTYKDAYDAMVEQVQSIPSSDVIDCGIYTHSAYVVGSYEYAWAIKKVTF